MTQAELIAQFNWREAEERGAANCWALEALLYEEEGGPNAAECAARARLNASEAVRRADYYATKGE